MNFLALAFNPLALVKLFVLGLDMGGGGGDTISERQMAQLGKEQFEFSKERLAEFDPYLKRALDTEIGVAEDARRRSDEQWQAYQQDFRPVESALAKSALDYGSEANLDRAAQEGEALAARQSAAARRSAFRDLQSTGVNPASGRYLATAAGLAGQEATLRANMANVGREQRRQGALGLQQNVTQIGRGLPATGLAAGQLAVGGAGQAGNTGAQGVGLGAAAGQAALPFWGLSADMRARRDSARAQEAAGWGSLIGTAAGIAIGSDENTKENRTPVKADLILEGLEEIPVEAWNYKQGEGDGGAHIGPMAQDVNAQFGPGAAPGGKMIDLVSMNGIALAGIQALAKKVKKLEKGGLDTARAKRDTEPRRVA